MGLNCGRTGPPHSELNGNPVQSDGGAVQGGLDGGLQCQENLKVSPINSMSNLNINSRPDHSVSVNWVSGVSSTWDPSVRLCQGVSDLNQGLIHEGGDTTYVTQVKSKKTFQEGGLVKRWKKLVESRRESQQNSQLSARGGNIMSGGSFTVHQGEIDARNFEKCDPSTTCLSQDMI